MSLENKNNAKSKLLKIAIVHPKIGSGGSEARALWLVDALKDDYDVSLITGNKIDIEKLNKYYGTHLTKNEFKIICLPLPFWLSKSQKLSAVKGRIIQKYCQYLAKNFDLMISAYNPIDFGKKSIQFIADISFDKDLRKNFNNKKEGRFGKFLGWLYSNICNWISKTDIENFKKDFVIANSNWTKNLFKEKYNLSANIVYPPVASNFPVVPFLAREKGFVCIGRVVPQKRIDEIIAILEGVRRKGHNVNLHIVGEFYNDNYSNNLKNICSKSKDWIYLKGKLNESEKKELISKNRFGINACKEESFGIAVAEMVKGGCIVFAPNSGGQTEIINNGVLLYDNVTNAVDKIVRVLKAEAVQFDILRGLSAQSEKFSIERFKAETKELVCEVISSEYKK